MMMAVALIAPGPTDAERTSESPPLAHGRGATV